MVGQFACRCAALRLTSGLSPLLECSPVPRPLLVHALLTGALAWVATRSQGSQPIFLRRERESRRVAQSHATERRRRFFVLQLQFFLYLHVLNRTTKIFLHNGLLDMIFKFVQVCIMHCFTDMFTMALMQ
jgi:hypothetical protein